MASVDDWKPEEGMEVFIVPNDTRYKPRVETITKVARKYFYTQGYCTRYFIETKNEDNGGNRFSLSHCYRSEDDYRRVLEIREKKLIIAQSVYKLTGEQIDMVYEWIMAKK